MSMLCIVVLIAFLIIVAYVFLIGNFIQGWKRIPYFETKGSEPKTRATIITACKNERDQLPTLFQAVNEQTYRNFDFMVVDDSSNDGSWEYTEEAARGFPELKVLKNGGAGKKSAIRRGVHSSTNELVITLDADSTPSSEWLKTIVQFYEEYPSDLIICPVKSDAGSSFFYHFQQFEFVSLVASGAGATGLGMPILCNGANLAFRRDAWLMSESDLQFEEPSGDDIFLLQSIKNRNGVIRFLNSTRAMTITQPAENLKAFFKQRKRWASKFVAFNDIQLAFTALIVFLTCFSAVLSLFFALVDVRFLYVFLMIFISKWIIDSLFFKTFQSFFNLTKVLRNSLLFSVFYPFYIVYTAGITFMGKKNNGW